jgi:hypothetical protein
LVKLKSFSGALLSSRVPAWAFAAVLFCALLGLQFFVRHVRKNRRGKIHFVPDGYNCAWAAGGGSPMDVRVRGMFTYDRPSTVVILKARLKGTTSIGDMIAEAELLDGSGRRMVVPELCCEHNVSARAVINMRLSPVLGTEGKPYRGQLVFHDRFNREFYLDPMDFPWTGKR